MKSKPLEIIPVVTRRNHIDFCGFPYSHYQNDENWVPPLVREERRKWAIRTNASLAARWQKRFIARRDGRTVGRIAAIVDQEFANRWFEKGGMFGFFECEDDVETAAELFRAVETSLNSQGVTRVIGPINLTTHDETGILVDGFECSPVLLSPYNPNYYETLILNNGYQAHSDYNAFSWEPDHPYSEAVTRILSRFRNPQNRSFDVRCFTRKRWSSDIRQVQELYNASFANTWGFVPICWNEFEQRAEQFRQFYRPELCLLAESGKKAIGFAVVLPDVNEALMQTNGRLLPLGWLRIARAIPRIRSVRFVLIGVLPEFAGQGVAFALVHAAIEQARQVGIRYAELSLVHNQNHRMQKMIRAFVGDPCKTFRLFHKNLPDQV